ncbi:MAG: hypothetical protein NW214_11435 [Pseudanabaenaceae cyanobacterium bins.39]|nr:hypothetical protein [Pseudanabaenaceae cyanobacterium bins.39]
MQSFTRISQNSVNKASDRNMQRNIGQSPVCLTPMPSTWVNVLEPPTPNCHDEAWLMCQYEDGHWAAWIPDFGEIKLHSGQFCRMS